MATKTFKVGEYGFCPYYMLTTNADNVIVRGLDETKFAKHGEVRMFNFDDCHHFSNYMTEQTNIFFADKMIDWLSKTKHWKNSLKVCDPYGIACVWR